jgi:hypothetical protein
MFFLNSCFLPYDFQTFRERRTLLAGMATTCGNMTSVITFYQPDSCTAEGDFMENNLVDQKGYLVDQHQLLVMCSSLRMIYHWLDLHNCSGKGLA